MEGSRPVYAHAALVVGLAVAGLGLGRLQRAMIARYVPSRGAPPVAAGLVTGALLGVLGARVHPPLVLAAACALAVCAVPLAFIDAAVQRLPDPLTTAAYVGTVLLLFLAAAVSGHWGQLGRAVLGGAALAAFYLLLLFISPSGMGMGDVKLAVSLGTVLAWPGWRVLVLGGFAGFLLAAVYSIALLATHRATRKQRIPFGPFMIAGAFLTLILALCRSLIRAACSQSRWHICHQAQTCDIAVVVVVVIACVRGVADGWRRSRRQPGMTSSVPRSCRGKRCRALPRSS